MIIPCHIAYYKKYGGFCLDCFNAGVPELMYQLAELQTSMNLRWKADRQAIKLWEKATGKKLMWPDHADLCMWLMEQLAKNRRKIAKS